GVHVVAAPGLARPAVPAAVLRDAGVALAGQKDHLVLPGVRAQRPPVAEDHRLPAAPVLVVNLGAVLDRDGAHVLTAPARRATRRVSMCGRSGASTYEDLRH